MNTDGTYDIRFEDGERKRGITEAQIEGGGDDRDRDDRDRSSSSASSSIREGDKVEAKCTGWTKYFKGEVTSVNRDGSYDIKFEDGERKRGVEKTQVRSLGGSSTGTSSKIAEGASIRARYRGANGYTRGKIAAANRDGTYDIKYNDGLKESNVERRMIKVDSDDNGFGERKSPSRSKREPSPRLRSYGSLGNLD